MKDYDIFDNQNKTDSNDIQTTQEGINLQKEQDMQQCSEQTHASDTSMNNTHCATPIETENQRPQESMSPFIERKTIMEEDTPHIIQDQITTPFVDTNTSHTQDVLSHANINGEQDSQGTIPHINRNDHAMEQESFITNDAMHIQDTPSHSNINIPTMNSSPSTHEEPIIRQSEAIHATNTKQAMYGETNNQTHEDTTAKAKGKKSNNTTSTTLLSRNKSLCLLSACLLLSIGGGFGGAMIGNQLSGNRTVLYQSTTAKGTNTSTSLGTNMSVKEIANKTGNSVVAIKTESMSTNKFFQQAVQSGAGSGVILSKDGYIVTNNHVISGANKVTVTTKDGKSYSAKLIGTDPATDLAVIKITATDLAPAIFGESSKLEVGDTAIAIGNPLGELGGTVTSGIISALDREITIENQTMHLLQTSAAINPGNSGGGLFNDQGQLIGVVNAKSSGSNIEGLGFAIPIDRAKDIISNLIQHGAVKDRAALGVALQEIAANNPEIPNRVVIARLEPGKAAEKAGLKVNDQILKIKDKEVTSVSDVKTAINSYKAGNKISITILRNAETKTITVTLGEASTTTENSQPQENRINPFQGN